MDKQAQRILKECELIQKACQNITRLVKDLLEATKRFQEDLKLHEKVNREISSPERIKSLRQSLGLSQKAFAERLGISLRTLQRWERGESKPSKMAIFRLVQLLREVENQ